jgi:hypothetical protein
MGRLDDRTRLRVAGDGRGDPHAMDLVRAGEISSLARDDDAGRRALEYCDDQPGT